MTHLTTRRGLWLLPLILLTGCDLVVLNPAGDIANQQSNLIVISTMLMLLIIVPVIILTFVFAWRYRKGNTEARYEPEWDHSTKLELLIWGAPLLIIIVLGVITWVSTHKLDPYRPLERIDAERPLAANYQPMTVQVVSLDWKWLFIYPEQGIATVNELVTPVGAPIRFKLTSSNMMNSFYIPALAGQIYTMAGMETQLNAVINKQGVFDGFSANYSGAGFSDMGFKYHAVSDEEFEAWVKSTRGNVESLDRTSYVELEKQSEREPVRRYGKLDPELFEAIVNRCVAPGTVCMKDMMMADANRIRIDAAVMNMKKKEVAASLAVVNDEVCGSTPNLMKNEDARAY